MTPASALLDRFLLSLCIWREARGESFHGKELVAWTIVNRATDQRHRWPATITGVVLQPMQFSSFNPGDPNAVKFPSVVAMASMAGWEDCVSIADRALVTTPLVAVNHYHVLGITPPWADPTKVVTTEGAHVFYEL